MPAPSTLPLELIVLFLSAGALAVAGVLAMALVEPRRRRTAVRSVEGPRRTLALELLGAPVLSYLGAALLGTGLLAAFPLRLGPPAQLELAFATGTLGSFAVALFTIAVIALIPRPSEDAPVEVSPDRRSGRGWIAAGAVSAGAGGAALLTLIGLYIALDGHEPSLIAAALGAGVGALAGRAPARRRAITPSPAPSEQDRIAWIRSMAPIAVARALDLYLLFLVAATGASALAFVPSVVRLVQPNSVLFPVVALAVVFVASLVAIPFAPSGEMPTGSLRRVAELGPAAFGFIALLVVVPPYLPGGLGLFLSGVAGAVVAPLVILLVASGADAPARSTGLRKALRAGTLALAFGGVVVAAFWLTDLAIHFPLDLSTSSIGTYGLGLATVAAAGTLGGLFAVDLGGRFTSALLGSGEAGSPGPPCPRVERFSSAASVGSVFVAGLSVLALVTGLTALVPLEAGVAPGSLVGSLSGSAEGRLLGGVALGLLIPVLTATLLAYRAPVLAAGPSEEDRSLRLRIGSSVGPLALGVALPILGGELLGAAGLIGLVVGAVLGTLWHGFSFEVVPLGPPGRGPASTLLPTLATAALTAMVVGGSLYSGLRL